MPNVRLQIISAVEVRMHLEIENLSSLQRRHESTHNATRMGVPFDYAEQRPDHIEAILNGLDRYNPETTGTFQDYVQHQCESQTYDSYANLALLKL